MDGKQNLEWIQLWAYSSWLIFDSFLLVNDDSVAIFHSDSSKEFAKHGVLDAFVRNKKVSKTKASTPAFELKFNTSPY